MLLCSVSEQAAEHLGEVGGFGNPESGIQQTSQTNCVQPPEMSHRFCSIQPEA